MFTRCRCRASTPRNSRTQACMYTSTPKTGSLRKKTYAQAHERESGNAGYCAEANLTRTHNVYPQVQNLVHEITRAATWLAGWVSTWRSRRRRSVSVHRWRERGSHWRHSTKRRVGMETCRRGVREGVNCSRACGNNSQSRKRESCQNPPPKNIYCV